MKRLHNVVLSMFVKPEEDAQELERKFLSIVPFSLGEEKLALQKTVASGFNERKITILEIVLQKERHTNALLDHLVRHLSGAQKQQLLGQDNRLDDDCDFFLRFKKEALPQLILTNGGDCLHVKLSIAAFPKRRQAAEGVIKEIFK